MRSYLTEITRAQLEHKSEEQKIAKKDKEKPCKRQAKVIEFHNDYIRMVSETKYKSIHRKEIKILTPKQMHQILPIALAQVKADNTSGNLVSEISQIIYSSYWAKEMTKNVYHYIMNSKSYKT